MPRHPLFTPLDLKSVAADGTFEGYAALFDREDLGHDVILPGAFTKALAARPAAAVKLLYQHDPTEPIGLWEYLAEDAKGLLARGRLLLDIARAREVHTLMRAGALDGLSIGFRATRSRRDPRTQVRRLAEIDLWEISIVTFPMQPGARIAPNIRATESFHRNDQAQISPYSAGPAPTERELERRLTQDARLTRSQARALMRSGLTGLRRMQDAALRTATLPDAEIAQRLRALTRLIHPRTSQS